MGQTMSLCGKLASFIGAQARLLTKDISGATAIEYGTVALFIAVVIVGSVNALGLTTKGFYETVLALVK